MPAATQMHLHVSSAFSHLAVLPGDVDSARAAALRAWELGCRDSWVDSLIRGGSGALAEIESYGKGVG
jgi:hypothetical protein